MDKLAVGIIGIGHLGSKHLKVYHELSEQVDIVGICDVKYRRTKKLADHYGVSVFKNYKDLISKVDAVSICVPTSDHYTVAHDFLENGIHVLVEKPITTTVDEAKKLTALAEKKKLKLQVGHVERFNSAFRAITTFAKNPLFVECHRLNLFSKRSLDIGVVMDLMIHDIDILLGLIDSPVKDIQAVGVKVLTSREDIANARITFKNGCVCNLTASRVSSEVMRKIRIFLNNTYISLDYVNQEAFVYKKLWKHISKHAIPIEKEEPLKKEIESFIECIERDHKPIVSGVEGTQALKVALDITNTLWKHQRTTS